jgi:hypothetical protein
LAAILLNVLVSYFLSNYVRFLRVFKAGGKILPFQGFWALGPQKKKPLEMVQGFIAGTKTAKVAII